MALGNPARWEYESAGHDVASRAGVPHHNLSKTSAFKQSAGRRPHTTSMALCIVRSRSSRPDSSDQYAACEVSTVCGARMIGWLKSIGSSSNTSIPAPQSLPSSSAWAVVN